MKTWWFSTFKFVKFRHSSVNFCAESYDFGKEDAKSEHKKTSDEFWMTSKGKSGAKICKSGRSCIIGISSAGVYWYVWPIDPLFASSSARPAAALRDLDPGRPWLRSPADRSFPQRRTRWPGLKVRNPGRVEIWNNTEITFFGVTHTSEANNLDDVQRNHLKSTNC